MNALERNNFVVTHASAEFFAKDLEYYKKLFPTSKLIKDLERCPEFRKKELDARMLHEMLASQNICHECILENRGIVTMAQKQKDEEEAAAKKAQAITDLLAVNLADKFDFNHVKELATLAGVTLVGKTKADLVASIEQWKKAPAQQTPPPVVEGDPAPEGDTTTKPDAGSNAPAPEGDDNKKKEGQE